MMYGDFKHSEGEVLHYVLVTAVDIANDQTILLLLTRLSGLRMCFSQELLSNMHHMQNAGTNIDKCLCMHGGLQQITLDNAIILLYFVDISTTLFASFLPLSTKMDTLSVICISL